MNKNHSRITDVLALLCLTVFALCLLLVLLMGAELYQELVNRGEDTYTRRTALQYLTTRVRQAETLAVGNLEGCEVLLLGETVGGERYITYVYCYEGWLRELYTVPGAKLPLRAGTEILEAENLSFHKEEALLTIRLDEDTLFLYLPWEGVVTP